MGALALVLGTGAPVARADHPRQGTTCGGADTLLTSVSGTLSPDREGGYVFVPFEVPADVGGAPVTRVRVKLSHDQPPLAADALGLRHTLDLGLYEPSGDGFWDREEFRGWGGSSRLNACVSPRDATPGFLPGAIPAGTWAAEVGVAAVVEPAEGDPDGVSWTLQVFVSTDPAYASPAWQPTPYDTTPANPNPGWYRGDFHVHAEHSNPADATMHEVVDYAFGPAGLDFITLSDYVTTRHWDEVGAFQALHPGKLIIRSAEVITYRGHVNNHASLQWADYRTGPIWKRQPDGTLVEVRGPVAPGAEGSIFDQVHGGPTGSGWTQINHPTTFPAAVPLFDNLCRGCSWEYSDAETQWQKVDAMEVQTGPAGTPAPFDGDLGPNPFTPPAIARWDQLHRLGFDITAVGSSDSHKAGSQNLTQSPIGEATTVVRAPELSEAGIREGVLAGHAFVKFFGANGPELRFEAMPYGGGPTAIMGDEVVASSAVFTARLEGGEAAGPGPLQLLVVRDGVPYLAVPVPETLPFEFSFVGVLPGDYRLQVVRGTAIEALTNPITLIVPGHPLTHTHPA